MQRLPSISQDDVQVSVLKQKFILIIISNSEVNKYNYFLLHLNNFVYLVSLILIRIFLYIVENVYL